MSGKRKRLKASGPVGRACSPNGHQQMGQENNRMDAEGKKKNDRKTKAWMERLHRAKGRKQLDASGTKSSRVEVLGYLTAVTGQVERRRRIYKKKLQETNKFLCIRIT